MKTPKVNLPVTIEVDDYHEFRYIESVVQDIIKGFKIEEIGCYGKYVGIGYIGSLKNKKNKALIKNIKKDLDSWNEE